MQLLTVYGFTVLAAAVFGAVVGSFGNVAIHRWPRGGSVNDPKTSYCPGCEEPIAWHDNVPLVSWFVLRGRCRRCGSPIAPRYPAVEALTAAVWGGVAAVHGPTWLLPALLAFAWVLIVAAVIDLEHRIIPNLLTLRAPPVLLALLVVAAITGDGRADLTRAVIAGVGVPGVMLALSEGFRLLRGKVGIGMGDIKLAISIGLVLGYLGGWELVIFFYATLVAAVAIAGALIATGRAKMATRIPFGPYLAVGSLLAVLAGDPLRRALEGWFGIA